MHRFRAERSILLHLTGRLIPVGMVLLAVACSNFGARTRAMFGGDVTVKVQIAPDANQDSPVALDLLIVYDEALLERLLGMTSQQWFAERTQIKKDFLPEEGLDAWQWEWVPGQKVPDIELPLEPSAEGAVIFVNYFSPGPHRFRIDPFSDFTIRFERDEVFIEPM